VTFRLTQSKQSSGAQPGSGVMLAYPAAAAGLICRQRSSTWGEIVLGVLARFNGVQNRALREVQISGKTVVFEKQHRNGLYERFKLRCQDQFKPPRPVN
jgi:hypothetical protein